MSALCVVEHDFEVISLFVSELGVKPLVAPHVGLKKVIQQKSSSEASIWVMN